MSDDVFYKVSPKPTDISAGGQTLHSQYQSQPPRKTAPGSGIREARRHQ
jgi:hypothetical protein